MFCDSKKSLSGKLPLVALFLCGLLVLVTTGSVTAADKKPVRTPKIDAKTLAMMVQHFDKVEKLEFSWGWIRWLMSSKLDPKSEMTFGVVHLNAGEKNPMHVHPNCEEHLYVLSGSCEHWLGKKSVMLKKGDVIRIPRGVPHKARTFKEPMEAIIIYSAGDRKFEVVEEKGAKKPGAKE